MFLKTCGTMNHTAAPHSPALSIAAVERDTGLSKDTLRVWERRYGFPVPLRDSFGERAYPPQQLEKLRIVKRLLDVGHRPGRIVAQSIDALNQLSHAAPATTEHAVAQTGVDLLSYMQLIQLPDVDNLHRALNQAAMQMGLAAFVCNVVAPLNVLVGDAWARGQLEVYEEHLYTQSIQAVLHDVMRSSNPTADAEPRVLLTTFPHETHALGLLMAQAMMRLNGCFCVSLGTQTPVVDIVNAAAAHDTDIVALSFTASLKTKDVAHGLTELRHKLPQRVQIWVGGHCPSIARKPPAGVMVITDLQDIKAAVANWRIQQSSLVEAA